MNEVNHDYEVGVGVSSTSTVPGGGAVGDSVHYREGREKGEREYINRAVYTPGTAYRRGGYLYS